MKYEIIVKDINNITNPVKIDCFNVEAYNKADAMDIAHPLADKKHPHIKKLLEIREIRF